MNSKRKTNSEEKSKILVYLIGSLGDTIVAIPALRAVRRHFRDCELILLQNSGAENLVKSSEVIPADLIDGFLSYEDGASGFDKLGNFYRLRKKLRAQNFEAAVYLVISERPARSVARDRLFFRSCGIRRFFGFHPFTKEELYPLDAKTNHPATTENEAARKLKRLRIDGIESLPEDLRQPLFSFSSDEIETMKKRLAERRKKPNAPLVAIAPGCKAPANLWAVDNFIEIGRRLIDKGFEILIIGGRVERAAGEKMIAAFGEGINTAGELSVRESGAALSLCDFYIGLNTGTTHLAAAVGTDCFAVYGEHNNPGQWYPLGDRHAIVFHPVECAGCRHIVCPVSGHPCMTGITVEAVWQKLQEFINASRNPMSAPTKVSAV